MPVGKLGRMRLLDPNCKYAHAEQELAYVDLFRTATPTFFKTYNQSRRLPPEFHKVRKPVYQLFSLLNHLRLFGNEYLKLVMGAVEKVGGAVVKGDARPPPAAPAGPDSRRGCSC